MFLFHLANLPVESLARRVYEEERRLDFGDNGGLVSDCRRHLAELNIREGLLNCVTKSQWRQIVVEKLGIKNKADILGMCKHYRKLDYFELREDTFELKRFFKDLPLARARTLFCIKVNMIRYTKMNFMNDPVFAKQNYKCENCDKLCSTDHILICEGYKQLREGKDLSSDSDLITYFQDVIRIRENNEKEKNIVEEQVM